MLAILLVVAIGTIIGLVIVQRTGLINRDQARLDDLNKLNIALIEYYQKYGTYPEGEGFSTDEWWGSNEYIKMGNPLAKLISEGFLDELPTDPINNTTGCFCKNGLRYYYCYYKADSKEICSRSGDSANKVTGKWYHLSTCLENESSNCQTTCAGVKSIFSNYCAKP